MYTLFAQQNIRLVLLVLVYCTDDLLNFHKAEPEDSSDDNVSIGGCCWHVIRHVTVCQTTVVQRRDHMLLQTEDETFSGLNAALFPKRLPA